jgi:hypothetical protein
MITISRSLTASVFGIGFACLTAGILTGCAAPAPRVVAAVPDAVPTGRVDATIVAIRPVPPAAPQGGDAILAAMSAAGSPPAGQSEVILRTDQGTVLSIVQSDTVGLTVGARVVVLTSPRLQIARPGYSTPIS